MTLIVAGPTDSFEQMCEQGAPRDWRGLGSLQPLPRRLGLHLGDDVGQGRVGQLGVAGHTPLGQIPGLSQQVGIVEDAELSLIHI